MERMTDRQEFESPSAAASTQRGPAWDKGVPTWLRQVAHPRIAWMRAG